MKIALIGYRCSGKTSVGRELAARLGWRFVDTDGVVEERAGKSVAAIFAEEGEKAFRALERKAFAELAGADDCVIAAGGGALAGRANVAALKRDTKVIWLETSAEELARRAREEEARNIRRPPLTDLPLEEEIRAVLAKRAPRYKAAADCIVATDGYATGEIVERILSYLELIGAIAPHKGEPHGGGD
jgi:shikimate kinase